MRLAGSRPWCTIRQDPLVLVAHGSEERAGPSSSRDFLVRIYRTYMSFLARSPPLWCRYSRLVRRLSLQREDPRSNPGRNRTCNKFGVSLALLRIGRGGQRDNRDSGSENPARILG